MEESLPNSNPALLAKRRQKLALSYQHAGEHAAATLQFVRSLEAHETAFGPEHAETGRMLTEAGAALHQAGDHAAALRHLTRALQIHEKTLAADAPEVAQNLYCQAMVYEDSGNLDQAAAQYERVLLLRGRQVAGNELELAEVLFYFSRVCLALGRLARAEEMARSAIPIIEQTPGPELASTLELLAKIYERSDRQPEAAAANERARFIWNGERHALRQRSGLVFSRATTPFASRSS
jgi:tetratricopeptide (TPR) repeat protein